MNILAEEQKKLFDKSLTEKELNEKTEEFLKLYYKLREKDENSIWNRLTLEQRKRIHWLILLIYKIKNRLGNFSYEVLNDKREKTDRPIIFVISHVGKFDIEVVSEVVKDHYYLLSGDYEHIQGIIDVPFLLLNGVLFFNEKDKADRKLVTQKMINHLNSGGNLMYFIEGTWNITPNLPMLPCYWGIVDIAKSSNAIIIPIAADQYGKKFVVNVGENFDMAKFGNGNEEKSKAITELRDVLATLKWEIWESLPPLSRKDVVGDEWGKYKAERFKEWPYFNEEYIDGLIYKPKSVVNQEDVYAPIKKLVPSKNNAFLLNKRNSGYPQDKI